MHVKERYRSADITIRVLYRSFRFIHHNKKI